MIAYFEMKCEWATGRTTERARYLMCVKKTKERSRDVEETIMTQPKTMMEMDTMILRSVAAGCYWYPAMWATLYIIRKKLKNN